MEQRARFIEAIWLEIETYEREIVELREKQLELENQIREKLRLKKQAEEVYKDLLHRSGAENARTRRYEFLSKTLTEAVYETMRQAGDEMHAEEVLERLKEGGAVIRAQKPILTITSILSRNKGTYERVGPNTYRLKELAGSKGSQ